MGTTKNYNLKIGVGVMLKVTPAKELKDLRKFRNSKDSEKF